MEDLHEDVGDNEFEDEYIVMGDDQDGGNDDGDENAGAMGDGDEHGDGGGDESKQRVWRAGLGKLEDGEVLDYEPSAYTLYHKLNMEWPSLSFDVLPDSLGAFRTKFPLSMYLVAGSQADQRRNNKVTLLKISNVYRMKHNDLDDEEGAITLDDKEDDDDDLDEDPIVNAKSFRHDGGVNRIRVLKQRGDIIATWSDVGRVNVFNVASFANIMDSDVDLSSSDNPAIFTFDGHGTEGFALDWSPTVTGRLATGGCDNRIFIHNPSETGWVTDLTPYTAHTAAIEDIQWAPKERTVFASCSSDGTIRVFDTRSSSRGNHQLYIDASSGGQRGSSRPDCNVISWNKKIDYLMASGSDDGSLKIWDFRAVKEGIPVAYFDWHQSAITSVEWHPHEDSVLAVSSEDNTVTVWDMALEADPDEEAKERTGAELGDLVMPPQLLFEHGGQKHIKEVHFHPQIPDVIMSTAEDGLDLFRPANLNVVIAPAINSSLSTTTSSSSSSAAADGVTID